MEVKRVNYVIYSSKYAEPKSIVLTIKFLLQYSLKFGKGAETLGSVKKQFHF